jgi:hypothetical protein
MTDTTREKITKTEIPSHDFALYDRCLYDGRQVYLAGLGCDANPHPKQSDAWDYWREGYDQ